MPRTVKVIESEGALVDARGQRVSVGRDVELGFNGDSFNLGR